MDGQRESHRQALRQLRFCPWLRLLEWRRLCARAYINGLTPGLQNAFVGAFGRPFAKFNCGATYHYLAVATQLNKLNSTLGHSIDLSASYSFTKDISLTAGYTMMFGTETMDRLKQGNSSKTARWGWFSFVISPTLFTTKW